MHGLSETHRTLDALDMDDSPGTLHFTKSSTDPGTTLPRFTTTQRTPRLGPVGAPFTFMAAHASHRPAGTSRIPWSRLIHNLDRLLRGHGLVPLWVQKAACHTFGGGSRLQLFSTTGRAAPCRCEADRLRNGSRSSLLLSSVHMESLGPGPAALDLLPGWLLHGDPIQSDPGLGLSSQAFTFLGVTCQDRAAPATHFPGTRDADGEEGRPQDKPQWLKHRGTLCTQRLLGTRIGEGFSSWTERENPLAKPSVPSGHTLPAISTRTASRLLFLRNSHVRLCEPPLTHPVVCWLILWERGATGQVRNCSQGMMEVAWAVVAGGSKEWVQGGVEPTWYDVRWPETASEVYREIFDSEQYVIKLAHDEQSVGVCEVSVAVCVCCFSPTAVLRTLTVRCLASVGFWAPRLRPTVRWRNFVVGETENGHKFRTSQQIHRSLFSAWSW